MTRPIFPSLVCAENSRNYATIGIISCHFLHWRGLFPPNLDFPEHKQCVERERGSGSLAKKKNNQSVCRMEGGMGQRAMEVLVPSWGEFNISLAAALLIIFLYTLFHTLSSDIQTGLSPLPEIHPSHPTSALLLPSDEMVSTKVEWRSSFVYMIKLELLAAKKPNWCKHKWHIGSLCCHHLWLTETF